MKDAIAGLREAELDERKLWYSWRREGELKAREHLVQRYLWLAKSTAMKVFRDHQWGDLDPRDLVQHATVGLLEALDRFDPDIGASFASFAKKRIQGAVLDGMMSNCEARSQLAAAREMRRERISSLANNTESGPRDRLAKMVDVAIGLAIGVMLGDTAMFVDETRSVDGPYASGEAVVMREQFRQIVEGIPEQQRTVIRYHYYHEMSFTHIDDLLGVTKARISQIHTKALAEIRRRFAQASSLDDWV
jgi:RNA polymerase sigma factor for flagellar operon FliA